MSTLALNNNMTELNFDEIIYVDGGDYRTVGTIIGGLSAACYGGASLVPEPRIKTGLYVAGITLGAISGSILIIGGALDN